MRLAVAFFALPVVAGTLAPSPADAQTPMITAWLAANAECRSGTPGDPKTQKACEMRDQISARLERRGCVHHEDGDWWKCSGRH